jgi:lysozyme family protein
MKSVIRKTLNKFGINISDDVNPFEGDYIKKLNELNQEELFNSIKNLREQRYKDAATYKRHGKGWLNRLEKIAFEE